MSPVSPTLRDQYEYIIIAGKGQLRRDKPLGGEGYDNMGGLLEYARSTWRPPEREACRPPCPVSRGALYRCIQLYTSKG